MAMGWQKGTLFAAGILLGCGLGAWAVVGPLHAVHGPVAAPPAQDDAAAAAQTVADVKVASGPLRCDLSPIVPKAGSGDGEKPLQAHPTGASASEVSDQLLAGKEAEASGHQRDAEVAFLNACHSAQVVPGHQDALVADADYQLARLYANLAIAGGPRAGELRQRAEQLYGASLDAYRTRYGAAGEKTRFATEGLARLEQKFAGGGTAQVASSQAEDKPAAAAQTPVKAAPHETKAIPLAQPTAAPEPSTPPVSTAAAHVAASQSPDARATAPQSPDARTTAPRSPDAHATARSWEARSAAPQTSPDAAAPVHRPRETMAAVPLAQRTRSAAAAPDAPTSAASAASAASAPSAAPARHEHARADQPAGADQHARDNGSDSDPRNGARVATGDAHRPRASAPASETDDEEIIVVRPARRPPLDLQGGAGASPDDDSAPPVRWRHSDDDGE